MLLGNLNELVLEEQPSPWPFVLIDNHLNNLPVIIVTNSNLEADKRESFDTSAHGFLCKACNIDQFQSDIAFALK